MNKKPQFAQTGIIEFFCIASTVAAIVAIVACLNATENSLGKILIATFVSLIWMVFAIPATVAAIVGLRSTKPMITQTAKKVRRSLCWSALGVNAIALFFVVTKLFL